MTYLIRGPGYDRKSRVTGSCESKLSTRKMSTLALSPSAG